MSEACPRCGGSTVPASDLPPCLCELTPLETIPAVSLPEAAGGTHEHARALRCPSCGGWLEVGARRCTYCSVELAAVRCWRCFELAFAGSPRCAGCGARLGLEADLGETEARCPVCEGEPLHRIDVGDHHIRECKGCGGVLVDHVELDSLTRRTELDAGAQLVSGAIARAQLTEREVRYRSCPDCGVIMNRRNFGQGSGVIVDVCKPHGVWFDADELTAVLAFIASGGLREQRSREIQEAQRELSRRRVEALSEQSKLGGSSYGSADTFAVESAAALLTALFELVRWK